MDAWSPNSRESKGPDNVIPRGCEPVIGYDFGSRDRTVIVRGYKDEQGKLVIQSIEEIKNA